MIVDYVCQSSFLYFVSCLQARDQMIVLSLFFLYFSFDSREVVPDVNQPGDDLTPLTILLNVKSLHFSELTFSWFLISCLIYSLRGYVSYIGCYYISGKNILRFCYDCSGFVMLCSIQVFEFLPEVSFLEFVPMYQSCP